MGKDTRLGTASWSLQAMDSSLPSITELIQINEDAGFWLLENRWEVNRRGPLSPVVPPRVFRSRMDQRLPCFKAS